MSDAVGITFNTIMNSVSASSLSPAAPPASGKNPAPLPSATDSKWPICILGVPFDPVTINGAITRIDEMIATRQPHYVVTANVDFLVQAHRDVELRRILLDADLVLCDGAPLLWASRWLGNPLPERVAGSDLVPSLLRHAATRGHRIFFLGAAEGVAAQAAAALRSEHPNLNIIGHYAPPFAALLEMDHREISRRIREARPDLLLVSFGCPKQEKWIAMHFRALGVPVSIGVGATIDFLAGRMKRAPAWMQRTGTEWLFRLGQEPRRLFRRYAQDLALFVPIMAAQWWRLLSLRRPAAGTRLPMTLAARWWHVDAGAELTLAALNQAPEYWRDLTARPGHCFLHAADLQAIDGTGAALLVQWRKRLQTRGYQLVLLAPSQALVRTLASLRLVDYFPVCADAAEALRLAEATATQPAVLNDSAARSLAWCGEIIAANVEDVWQMTTDHIRAFVANRTTLVIVDLSRLRFIDTAGAGLMLRIKKWAQQFPAEILFTHAQPNVHNVLRLSRVDQLLLEGAQ